MEKKRPLYFFAIIALLLFSVYAIFKATSQQNICANSASCIKNLSGLYENKEDKGVFLGNKISVPKEEKSNFATNVVLGQNSLPKHIEVDLTTQRLYAFEGNNIVYNFLISSGKWYPTPTGTFNIWIKLRYTRMSGGNQAWGTYYNLPNVPFTMFFYNNEIPKTRGFALHGTYWHNNFGHPMSHGCVNMRTEDAEKIFYWADPPTTGYSTYAKGNEGTQIIIYGTTPQE